VQLVDEIDPAALYVPTPHALHALSASALYIPALHCWHEPPTSIFPALHVTAFTLFGTISHNKTATMRARILSRLSRAPYIHPPWQNFGLLTTVTLLPRSCLA
jgi:hypothetical protein